MSRMRILLTGASGFIGRNLREHLADPYELFCPSSKELDLTRSEPVEKYLLEHHFDVVLHAATWNATVNSTKDLSSILEKNLAMFFNLARMHDCYDRMIYYGSGAEYSREHSLPRMREEYFDTYVPVDQYGFSKYIMAKYTAGAENIVDLRIFGCFGPYEDWELRFISNAICKVLYDLPITINQNVFFDYIWIEDLVRITEWFMSNDSRYKHYNTCTGRTADLLSLAKLVKDIIGKEAPIKLSREGLKPEYSGDNARLLAELPNFQFTAMDEAIRRLAQYYSNNLDKIDRNLLLTDKR